jgi:hypothetical protein
VVVLVGHDDENVGPPLSWARAPLGVERGRRQRRRRRLQEVASIDGHALSSVLGSNTRFYAGLSVHCQKVEALRQFLE